MKKTRIVTINDDYTYFSDGTPLGKCEQCPETAYHYDENGSALCEDCLMENHANGRYDDESDFQCCDSCDLPDACTDFGCAIKNGIRKPPFMF